jgi:hypothetical protein
MDRFVSFNGAFSYGRYRIGTIGQPVPSLDLEGGRSVDNGGLRHVRNV